ncbi:MAG: hypothetical protein IPH35_18455 [Rhodoferax sp.]|nr:hypothetical protein [Rhodoferax sp.]
MKKSFQKTLAAASVGAVLAAVSMGAQAGTPGTTNLLFPYITTKAGAYTFISITNQVGTATPAGASTGALHFTYATKAIGADANSNCEHVDSDGATTLNDLMQFEVAKKIDLKTMVGDTTSTPVHFDGANREGFLVVNNSSDARYGTRGGYANFRLYGEARIIDTQSGLFFGYNTDDLHTTGIGADNTPDFSDPSGPDSSATSNFTKVLSWFPTSIVSTSIYAVPLNTEWEMGYQGRVRTHFTLVSADIKNTSTGRVEPAVFGGHYNNNEVFQSGQKTVGVTCFGSITRDALVGDLGKAWSTNGGWANLYSPGHATAGTTPSQNAVVFKQESTSALGGTQSFMSRLMIK